MGVETDFVYVNHEPDPSFPNGIPNPLLHENRSSTSNAIIREKADFGVAFDGDFDRCFLFDHLKFYIRRVRSWTFSRGFCVKIEGSHNTRSTCCMEYNRHCR